MKVSLWFYYGKRWKNCAFQWDLREKHHFTVGLFTSWGRVNASLWGVEFLLARRGWGRQWSLVPRHTCERCRTHPECTWAERGEREQRSTPRPHVKRQRSQCFLCKTVCRRSVVDMRQQCTRQLFQKERVWGCFDYLAVVDYVTD